MTPAPSPQLPQRPVLLNEKFTVHSYDGGSFKSRAQYDVKNALIPILEPFHCSGSGTKFNLVLKCSEDFTLTHFYVSGPGPRCTEPVKSGLVWVLDKPPEVGRTKCNRGPVVSFPCLWSLDLSPCSCDSALSLGVTRS